VLPASTSYTVVGDQFCLAEAGFRPPGVYEFHEFEYLQRQTKLLPCVFLVHIDLNDHV